MERIATPTVEPVEQTLESPKTTAMPKPTNHSIDKSKLTIKDGMVQIPEGLVDLGPRHVEAVKGYTLPQNPMGMTPNMGEGDNQRAAGGPPMPGMTSNGPPNGGGGGGKNGPPGPPTNGNQDGNANFPQHKPQV